MTAVHGLAGSGKTYLLEDALAQAGGFTKVTLPLSADVVRLELWQRLFDLDAAGSVDPDQLRESARSAIRASAEVSDAPLLIVFDECPDAHVTAAQAIAAAVLDPQLEVAAAFVISWRDELDGSTSPLQFELPSHRLEPFTEAQSAELLQTRTGKTPDPAVLAEIWRATAGNPAGMLSVSSRLSEDELDGLVPLPAPMPLGLELAEGFGAWMEQLDDDARLAVTVASAADLPRAILEEALSQVDLTLDALRSARSIGVLSIGADRVRFIHPLCRSAAFQLATHDSQRSARHAVTDALVGAGMPEQAAMLAATSATGRDEGLMSLCVQASRAGSQRSDHQSAARFLVLASRFAPTNEQAARHLIDASSLWQAAGQPDRARLCLQRVAPDNVSAAIVGHATYRSARSEFSLTASPHSLAEMAAGAEACATTEPEGASIMLADAAASAVLIDAFDAAMTYAERAVDIAADRPGARSWALFAKDAVATIASGPGTLEKNAMQDSMVGLTSSGPRFPGSPQLAYMLGSALVHVATPALMGRWLMWMDECVQSSGEPSLAAAVALVRSRVRLHAGDVPQAVSAVDFAVTQLSEVRDITLLARALGWAAWVHAAAGQTTRALEATSRFFALEQTALHLPHVQILSSLAHCELQKGRMRGAHAWLRALEDECDSRSGHRGCFDWPSLQIFLQLALLSHYEPELLGADVPVAPGADHFSSGVSEWGDGPNSAAALGAFQSNASDAQSPFLNAHLKLVAALKQRQIGTLELANFNFSRAETEFDECGAIGWSRLAAAQLGEAPRAELVAEMPAPVSPRAIESRPDPAPTEEAPEPTTARAKSSMPSAEVRLLGDFSVSYDGEPATIPLGHAAQALKIVALFRRISVDELAELLWPGAEPGVGTRRLRNILWRIKSASGDIVRRSDNLICLEDWVVTDVGAFEEAAAQAFDEGLSDEAASALAREAISRYGGELLPSDRYADWTTGPREALTQKRLQLLDHLFTQALSSGNRQDAMALLEELISADPYEERYYLQLATLHLEAGNRSRMRAAVSRAERMLAELGVQPSAGFVEFVSGVRDQ